MQTLPYDRSLAGYARLAGFMYLAIIALYMGGEFIGSGFSGADFQATAANIRAGETLYRASLTLELLSSLLCVLLAGALYAVLRPASPHLALFALVWRVCEVAIGSVGILIHFARIRLYTFEPQALDPGQLAELSRLFGAWTGAFFYGGVLSFAFGSTLFFALFLKSRLIPRPLSLLGIVGSLSILGVALCEFVLPGALPGWKWAPIFAAEVSVGLWLLIRGVDPRWFDKRASSTPELAANLDSGRA